MMEWGLLSFSDTFSVLVRSYSLKRKKKFNYLKCIMIGAICYCHLLILLNAVSLQENINMYFVKIKSSL